MSLSKTFTDFQDELFKCGFDTTLKEKITDGKTHLILMAMSDNDNERCLEEIKEKLIEKKFDISSTSKMNNKFQNKILYATFEKENIKYSISIISINKIKF